MWLAKAADHAISAKAVLVGGAAVNLHTGSYRPTDVDLCAYLDQGDRASLKSLGFRHLQGDHFEYVFADGQKWLLGFPDRQVDGEVSEIRLDQEETLDVISLESLVVDRMVQATDGTRITFDEAVRLCVATFEKTDWSSVEQEISRREAKRSISGLRQTYERVMIRTRTVLGV